MAHHLLHRPSKPFFLLCDIQEVFRGKIWEYPSVIHASCTIARAAQVLQAPMMTTEQYPKAFGHTVEELNSFTASVFSKTQFSMITDEVKLKLPDGDAAILFGIEAHVCVQQTTLDLLRDGRRVYLPVDAISSQRAGDRAVALHQLSQAGAILTTTESLLFTLLGSASHPKFKEISKIVIEHNKAKDLIGKLDRLQ